MKNKIVLTLLIVLGIALGAMVVRAQSAATSDGVSMGNYTVTQSAELGVRFLGRDGSLNKYRSDLNYGRGFRLFNYDFLARSKDGKGKLFDKFHVTALGWGGDPNEYLRIEVEKNKWYRFDSNFRRFDYFNNLTNLALNQHLADTYRRFGDFNLTLLPDNPRFRAYFGYTLDHNNGTSISTYDYSRDEFPLLAPVRSVANDYRFGIDAKLWVFDVSFLQGFRYFKDDTTYSIPIFEPGNNPTNATTIKFFNREIPTRGRLPFTRFSAHTLLAKKLDFTGQYIYTSSTTRYDFSENVTGTDFSGNNVLRDFFSGKGSAKRPNGIGNIGITYFVTDRLTLSETFRVNNFRIDGGLPLSETLVRTRTTNFGTTVLPTLFLNTLSFRSIGYRLISNTVEGDYKFHPRFSGHFGYRYTDRRVSLGASDQPPLGSFDSETQKNHTNSIFTGFKARPVNMWTVYFDYEHGESDNVFTRVSNYDFNNFRVRTTIKPTKTFNINASLITKNNSNPTQNISGQTFGVDVSGRTFTSTVDWFPNSKFSLTGGYTHNHLNSNASIIFFLNGVQTQGNSLYFLRDNYFFFNSFVQLHPRASLYIGYRINKDLGQGDRVASSSTQILSSYPLSYQSPEVRLSFKLREHVEWNLGWQFYNYREKLANTQNYRAHLPYTSLRFAF